MSTKITLTTIKSFIRKNRPDLLIFCKTHFDGMTDGCEPCHEDGFSPALDSDRPDMFDHDLGIHGAYFVRGGGDYFTAMARDGVSGYEVYNCCGCFEIGVRA